MRQFNIISKTIILLVKKRKETKTILKIYISFFISYAFYFTVNLQLQFTESISQITGYSNVFSEFSKEYFSFLHLFC